MVGNGGIVTSVSFENENTDGVNVIILNCPPIPNKPEPLILIMVSLLVKLQLNILVWGMAGEHLVRPSSVVPVLFARKVP